MKRIPLLAIAGMAVILLTERAAIAEIKTTPDHNGGDSASPAFKFKNVPSPSKTDTGTRAKFTIVDGERDENGGGLEVLHDGQLPNEEDQPGANFFFSAGTTGGRLAMDLGDVTEIEQVNTYSWHPGTRGPQVYVLYASDGKADGFNAKPKRGTDPEKCGWRLVAKVDTRPKSEPGGQYGVSISDSDGAIGKYRYLLFDISSTESDDDFGNTFYSEIDVLAKGDAAATAQSDTSTPAEPPYVTQSADGKCEITIDTSKAPDLTEWATNKLAPALSEWYPKIVAMLPSEGFNPPTHFSVTIKPGRGVAATGGTRITANSDWLKDELTGQAIGSLIHEEVHVVQQYGGGRRNNPEGTRPPGYLVEGIPDYIRWYLYEPQSHGAEIRARGLERAKYDGMYRVTANFLNFVVQNYDKDIITKLNAACRQRKYSDDLWKEYTGKTVDELNAEWKKGLAAKIAAEAKKPS